MDQGYGSQSVDGWTPSQGGSDYGGSHSGNYGIGMSSEARSTPGGYYASSPMGHAGTPGGATPGGATPGAATPGVATPGQRSTPRVGQSPGASIM